MSRKPFVISEKFLIAAEKMFALWMAPEHLSS
jgi:hypothetical protein